MTAADVPTGPAVDEGRERTTLEDTLLDAIGDYGDARENNEHAGTRWNDIAHVVAAALGAARAAGHQAGAAEVTARVRATLAPWSCAVLDWPKTCATEGLHVTVRCLPCRILAALAPGDDTTEAGT